MERMSTADIAAYLEYTREYVTDKLTKRADFPKPIINISQKKTLWDREDVIAWRDRSKATGPVKRPANLPAPYLPEPLPPMPPRDPMFALVSALLSAHEIRPRPGVYFLFCKDGNCIYVGQSGNVALRVGAHSDKPFDRATMITCEDRGQRLELERQLIVFLNPPLNSYLADRMRLVA